MAADELLATRREKLERLRADGVDPYPHAYPGVVPVAAVHAAHKSLPAGEDSDRRYRVAGRLHARRGQGKMAFLDLDGLAFRSRRGELSLRVEDFAVLSKSLRPPPDKFHGLSDVETRYRHRELDLIANAEARERFVVRAKVITAVRRYLDDNGFIEVETP